MEELLALLHDIALLPKALENRLRSAIRCEKFKAEEFILLEGEVCDDIFFIFKGVIRIFNMNDKKEVTTWILKEKEIFVSVDSFFGQIEAVESIQAIEDTVVYGITYKQLQDICHEFPEFTQHWITIQTQYYRRFDRRQKDLVSLTPEQRYLQLLENEPDLICRLPLKYICSYLVISKAALARIRKKHSSKKK